MNVNGKPYRTIWLKPDDPRVIQVIDQRFLPHRFVIEDLRNVMETARAIKEMHVRGAGLIGVAAAYGMYLAALDAEKESEKGFRDALSEAAELLRATRPTAVNLDWAVKRILDAAGKPARVAQKIDAVRQEAAAITEEALDSCRLIGEHGAEILDDIFKKKTGGPVNVLTHCNAGWLAFVDYGTATAPIYLAHDRGIPIHVWVDETRPRNQGARLTAWELGQHGVRHTVIADNTGGHLMQKGLVDIVITGSDRTTASGDVANKIGTYLKALAARDCGVPFYVAVPSSSFDWSIRDGLKEIAIEERDASEVLSISGLHNGEILTVRLAPPESGAANYAFDVTPARLVTGLITERGICNASEEGIRKLFPEKFAPERNP